MTRNVGRGPKAEPPKRDKTHLDELLDEGLEETFPASDTPAVIRPDHRTPDREPPSDRPPAPRR